MTMRKYIRLITFFLSLTALAPALGGGLSLMFATGCSGTTGSGASAPPISLPAPVTGRLTVTSPDEDGVALVIGDDGAVKANSVVHALNVTQATASIPNLVDLLALLEETGLIPSAEAQATLPEICGRSFHGCAIADANGSFEIPIQAADDDEIGVEIIDPATGTAISERTRHHVPRNFRHLIRPVLDVALLDNFTTSTHHLYALMGRTADDPNGLVSVVDLATNTHLHSVPFVGSFPTRMAVARETRRGAIIDTESNYLGIVDLTVDNFDTPSPFFPHVNPRDVAFSPSESMLYLSSASPTPLRRISPLTLGINAELVAGDFAPTAANIEIRSIDVIPYTTSISFDLIAIVGMMDIGAIRVPMLGLVISELGTAVFDLATWIPLAPDTDPRDVAFYWNRDRIMVTDGWQHVIQLYDFSITYPPGNGDLIFAGTVADPSGFIVNPRNITVLPTSNVAFVTAKNGTDTRADTVLTIDLASESVVDINPVGFGPTGLVFDTIDNRLFVSSFKSHGIAFWDLIDLLP